VVLALIRRQHIGLIALLLGLLGALLVHGRLPAPPIYAGIVVPPEPYRWESPPPNLRNGNKPPLAGEATLPVNNGQVAGGGVQTEDAQVIMYFVSGAFKAPSGASSIKCSITPVTNPPPPPSGNDIRGNVYQITCIGQPGNGPVTTTGNYHLTLRLPPGPFKEIQYNDGKAWRALATLRSPGGDPFASVNAPGFGDYAATSPTGSTAGGESIFAVLGRYLEFYGILAFVLIFGVIAVVQEVRRRRHRRPARVRKR
jgi:hypothetical protein